METLKIRENINSPWIEIPAIKGDKGDQGLTGQDGATGESGVYYGPIEPINPEIKVWIYDDNNLYTDGNIICYLQYYPNDDNNNNKIYQALNTAFDKENKKMIKHPILIINDDINTANSYLQTNNKYAILLSMEDKEHTQKWIFQTINQHLDTQIKINQYCFTLDKTNNTLTREEKNVILLNELEIQRLLNLKQNLLTAGQGITLDNSGNISLTSMNLSDFNNDSNFIDNTVDNLTNYYKKGETYTQTEINNLIGELSSISVLVVTELPTTGIPNTIYLVPKDGVQPDIHNEYLWVNEAFELIGTTQVDLSSYYDKNTIDNKLKDKVDKVNGQGLSSNDFTTDEKNKLANIAEGAEVNVQSDWNATKGDAFIKNKPSIPSKTSELNNNSGFITASSDITGNAATATTANKTIGTLTIQKNGSDINTFDGSQNIIANVEVPTVVNNLTSTSTTNSLSAKQGKILNDNKVDKITGKSLSTNDYTTDEKNKLANLNNYTLPIATKNDLGGIKIGENLSIDSNGKLSATAGVAEIYKAQDEAPTNEDILWIDTNDNSGGGSSGGGGGSSINVINNLNSTSSSDALSANMGKTLNDNKLEKTDAIGKLEGTNQGEIFNLYEGNEKNQASGLNSHSEGYANVSIGEGSHTEGCHNHVEGKSGHAEGGYNTANGRYAHANGGYNNANGPYSTTMGHTLSTTVSNSTMCGQYGDITEENDANVLFSVANGNSETDTNIGLKFQGLKGNGKLYIENKEVGLKEDIPQIIQATSEADAIQKSAANPNNIYYW